MNSYMIQLSTKFFEIAGKQSYDIISNKMKMAKAKGKTEEQQNAYDNLTISADDSEHSIIIG